MKRQPPRSARTDTRLPHTTLFRSSSRATTKRAGARASTSPISSSSTARRRGRPSACAASPANPAIRWPRRETRHPPRARPCRARNARREAGDGTRQPDLYAQSQLVDESDDGADPGRKKRSEEHTYELQSLMRISYTVLCWKNKKKKNRTLP